MNKIDLSKAKIGDKFRTRIGEVLTYKGTDGHIAKTRSDYHICARPNDYELTYFGNGTFIFYEEHPYDLVEQVFDKPLDELIEEGTKQIKENDDAIKEENELQRRQEVVELAEKLVTNELFAVTNHLHDMRELGAAINLDSPTEYAFLIAEEFVNNKSKYLENGKLC